MQNLLCSLGVIAQEPFANNILNPTGHMNLIILNPKAVFLKFDKFNHFGFKTFWLYNANQCPLSTAAAYNNNSYHLYT